MSNTPCPAIDPRRAGCFVAAIEEGTVRAAAIRLGLEPSSVSRQIGALGKDLAITLMERGRRGVYATEAGALLLAHLKRERGELEALRLAFDALQGMQRGTLSIAVGEGFIADLIGSALTGFAREHPGIGYALHTGSTERVLHDLLHDEAHLGLAYHVPSKRGIRTLATVRQPLMLLAGAGSPFAALPEPVDPATLASLPCALLDRSSGIGAVIELVEARHGIRLRATVETDSIAVLKNYVREGLGVSFMPRFVVVREILDGHIVAKPVALPEFLSGEARLLARQGRTLPDVALRFAAHLQRSMVALS